MLGWEIHIINNATGQEYGDWLTGHKGKDWIENLVDKGIAEKFYAAASSHYLIKAKDLIPLIIPSLSCYKQPPIAGEWVNDYVMDATALQSCLPEELIKIQTYDAS
jgi:hypothetical protein